MRVLKLIRSRCAATLEGNGSPKAITGHRAPGSHLHEDNPHTKDIYGKQLDEISDKITRQRLMLGIWKYESENALIDYDAFTDLFTNTIPESREKYLVADAARFGGERIVFTFWQGLKCYKTVNQVDAGYLSDGGRHPIENPAQCAYKLAEFVNTHQMAVTNLDESDKQNLIEELEQIKSKDADKDGKRKIRPKRRDEEDPLVDLLTMGIATSCVCSSSYRSRRDTFLLERPAS